MGSLIPVALLEIFDDTPHMARSADRGGHLDADAVRDRPLDQVKAERGLPKVIRTDNGPEFAGDDAGLGGEERRGVAPGMPMQNAYVESFNSRFRDECRRSAGSPA